MSSITSPVKHGYKQICQKIRRLPVDTFTLSNIQFLAKSTFSTPLPYKKCFDRKTFYKYTQLLDDIIIYENWPRLPDLLDDIYKHRLTANDYRHLFNIYNKFHNLNYDQLRHIYPQVELFHEMNPPAKYVESFNQCLLQEDEILVLKFIESNATTHLTPQEMLLVKRQSPSKHHSISYIIQQVQNLYEFIARNDKITHLKLLPFEVTYPSNKFGMPLHIIQRDKLLQDHLKYVKGIIKTYRPINKEYLTQLERVTKYQIDINKNFFKYMIKKRRSMVVNLKTNKSVIPDNKNIVKLYKEYLTKQFYVERHESRPRSGSGSEDVANGGEQHKYTYTINSINFYG